MNMFFGLRIKYYNGMFLYPAALLKKIKLHSYGHAIFADMLVRSLKMGNSVKEVPFLTKVESDGRSKALSLKNFANVGWTILILFGIFIFDENP